MVNEGASFSRWFGYVLFETMVLENVIVFDNNVGVILKQVYIRVSSDYDMAGPDGRHIRKQGIDFS